MFEIKIKLINEMTNEELKITKYNTFWDENGKLQGNQDYLKIQYEIIAVEE